MKAKTDPKTLTTKAILGTLDVSAACKTIDALRMAGAWEANEAVGHLADDIAAWVKNHKPEEKK